MNMLNKCFDGTRETPPRLLQRKADLQRAREHLEKATNNLRAMKLMGDSKFFDWAVSCGYYAMYHAVMASLWLIGLDARSHECAIAAFNAFYVEKKLVDKRFEVYLRKARKLDAKYSDSLEHARSERLRAQYGVGEVRSKEAEEVGADAKELVNAVENMINEERGFKAYGP